MDYFACRLPWKSILPQLCLAFTCFLDFLGRKKAAALIVASAESVALLRDTTEGITTVLSNWPLQAGDEILTSSAEHGPF